MKTISTSVRDRRAAQFFGEVSTIILIKRVFLQVGSSGCGKSSVIKTLANLAEKPLKTLPVTSAMDTTDILGGFEQVGFFCIITASFSIKFMVPIRCLQ